MGVVNAIAPVAERARRWRLAGDRRAGSYPRGLARRKQYEHLRRLWAWYAPTLVIVLALLLVAVHFISSDFADGLLLGGGLVAVLMALWNQVVYATGTAPTMMGDLGEQWTAQELRKLGRAGWRLVNHVMLTERDIDHVLVGRGGVFAVETKWTAMPWQWDPVDPRIVAAASATHQSARRLTLWKNLTTWHIGPVHPVVFLWGQGAAAIPADAEVDGVRIVTPASAAAWRASLPQAGLDAEQIHGAWRALDAQCRLRDPREEETTPVPVSPSEWATRLVVTVGAAIAGMLAIVSLVGAGLVWPLAVTWWVLMLTVGLAATRISRVRLLGLGWILGVLATAVFAAAVLIDWYV